MKITEQIMKQTYEETIDKNVDRIVDMQANGLTDENDILLLDTCLKYVIFMSKVRSNE